MKISFDAINYIVLPVIGYISLIWIKKRAMKSIELKVLSEGIYRFKPVYGDRAITLAHGHARGGVKIFISFIILPVAFLIIKLLI